MADYQFQPDMSDPIAQLRLAMDRMDGKEARSGKFTGEIVLVGSRCYHKVRCT
jgi:hypothetical protein